MNNPLIDTLERETNDTTTLNGDVAKKSTLNPLLDFFSQAGAMRGQDEKAVELFQFAYEEDPVYALQLLFWLRDVRGGAGERQLFRSIFCYLLDANRTNTKFSSSARRKLLELVPDYGRWDDLTLIGELPDVRMVVQDQLRQDLANWHKDEPISLLAKWLPSISASNKKAKELAKIYAKGLQGEDSLEVPVSFEGTQKEYRQVLRALRGQINIVEHLMCHGRWDEIKFGQVPSQAARRLRKAFRKHQPTRYQEYLDLVESGEEKINAGAMFPSDLVLEYLRQQGDNCYDLQPMKADQTINLQWEALPKWGEEQDILVMADVSGSMMHPDMTPMAASTSLAMYTAERNTNPLWKNRFMTFSSDPEFIKLNSAMPLHSKLHKVMQSPWGMSTNLRKAMALVFNCCKKQSDLPDAIIVVSDMQFDPGRPDWEGTSTYEDMKSMASELGFELPNIVWWNVNSFGNSPCTFDENGVAMLSGYSPTNLQMAFDGQINPMQAMHTLVRDNPRYQPVKKALITR